MVHGDPRPDHECFQVHGSTFLQGSVEGWIFHYLFTSDIFVHHQSEDWEHSVNRRITQDQESIVDRYVNEKEYACEDCLDERDDHATVHHELG